nr:MAG TPA: hypothetical protein [Crassvirales sp.]
MLDGSVKYYTLSYYYSLFSSGVWIVVGEFLCLKIVSCRL